MVDIVEGGAAAPSAAPAAAPASTPVPAQAPELSGDDARYAAAFAEAGISPEASPAAQPAPAPAAPAAGAEGHGGEQRPPLTEAELRQRYTNVTQALREERTSRREATRQLADLQAQIEQLRAGQGQQSQAAQIPDPNQDPIGFLEHLAQQESARQAESAAQRQNREVQEAQTRAVQSLVTDLGERERDFALENPDYFPAVNHLRSVRAEQYRAMGYAPEVAEQLVTRDALQTSADLIRQGKDPAQAWYALAKQSGYKPGAAPDAAAAAAAAAAGTPAAPAAPAPAAGATGTAAEALEKIRAGQEAAKSLSGAGGDANLQPTVEHALSLRGAAFDSYFDNLAAQERAAERRR